MKTLSAMLLLFLFPFIAMAQTQEGLKRTFRQFGAMTVIGSDTGWSSPGWGLSTREFTFFDPAFPEGPYYALFSGNIVHETNGQSLADTRVITLGWRLMVPQTIVHLDTSIAPVVGARFSGKTELGSTYTGVAASLGATVAIRDDLEIGFSWEPVWNVTTWENPTTKDLSYHDFVLSVILKEHTETKKLPW